MNILAIFSIDYSGNLTRLGRGVPSYDIDAFKEGVQAGLGDTATAYWIRVGSKWGSNFVVVFARRSGRAHAALCDFCRIAESTPENYVFAVLDCEGGVVSVHKCLEGAGFAQAQASPAAIQMVEYFA